MKKTVLTVVAGALLATTTLASAGESRFLFWRWQTNDTVHSFVQPKAKSSRSEDTRPTSPRSVEAKSAPSKSPEKQASATPSASAPSAPSKATDASNGGVSTEHKGGIAPSGGTSDGGTHTVSEGDQYPSSNEPSKDPKSGEGEGDEGSMSIGL